MSPSNLALIGDANGKGFANEALPMAVSDFWSGIFSW